MGQVTWRTSEDEVEWQLGANIHVQRPEIPGHLTVTLQLSLEAYLDAPDFDENFDRMEKNGASLAKLFEGVVAIKVLIEVRGIKIGLQ
jgi:hypothetical protein